MHTQALCTINTHLPTIRHLVMPRTCCAIHAQCRVGHCCVFAAALLLLGCQTAAAQMTTALRGCQTPQVDTTSASVKQMTMRSRKKMEKTMRRTQGKPAAEMIRQAAARACPRLQGCQNVQCLNLAAALGSRSAASPCSSRSRCSRPWRGAASPFSSRSHSKPPCQLLH